MDEDPLVELASIAADLRAHAAWEGLRGATLLPAETLRPRPVERQQSQRRPAAPPPTARPAEPVARPRPPTSRSGPARPARPAQPGAERPPAAPAGPPAAVPPQWEAFSSRAARPPQGRSDVDDAIRAAVEGAGNTPGEAMAAVREVLGDCERCRLCGHRGKIVFGVGDPAARLVVIGEGPGAEEDRQGEPFVGRAGEMLDAMITKVLGLRRADVYITNVVKCRPPDNRNPEADEIESCRPFLQAQLTVLEPELVLVLGSVAAKALFRTTRGITRLRGEWRILDVGGREVPVMATFHPAYLLRRPDDKKLTFHDLKAVARRLHGAS